ncbi:MAG: CHAT domain-containing protein, partial [Rivularia sp. (in: cyanobacteria)]
MSSQQQINELQKLSDLLEEKILRLRTAKAIETSAAVIFQVDKQIQEAEAERDKITQEIAQLNQQKYTSNFSNNTKIKTILILAANPKNTSRLRLEEEIREIDEGLRRANKREQFKLEMKLAVRQRDFYRAILDTHPQIVHFCGHGGGEDGIVLEDETGTTAFVEADTLASQFKLFARKGVECVVLNACYSEIQADAIHQHINYVIGMNRAIGDKAAINFAVAFYDALAAGEDV